MYGNLRYFPLATNTHINSGVEKNRSKWGRKTSHVFLRQRPRLDRERAKSRKVAHNSSMRDCYWFTVRAFAVLDFYWPNELGIGGTEAGFTLNQKASEGWAKATTKERNMLTSIELWSGGRQTATGKQFRLNYLFIQFSLFTFVLLATEAETRNPLLILSARVLSHIQCAN